MYLSFYNLKHLPFQISTDPKFLWLGEKHKEALATLRYGVMDNKGFLLLTGDVGTGKTTLINTLLKELDNNVLVATIRDPALDTLDFYNYTAYVFGLKDTFASKVPFLIQFERFLLDAEKSGKKVLLIIDEAQRISQELLEEVRLLSNIEKEGTKLLNIFFVGQNEFNDTLLRHENRAIRQRITVNYHLLPLSVQETRRYIRHRLEIAGAEEEVLSLESLEENHKGEFVKHSLVAPDHLDKIFSDEAVEEVYSFSKGYPRLINIICDRSLLTGFVEEAKVITRKHVEECAKELTIPRFTLTRTPMEEIVAKQSEPEIPPPLPAFTRKKDPPVSKKQETLVEAPAERKKEPGKHRIPYAAVGVVILLVVLYVGFSSPPPPPPSTPQATGTTDVPGSSVRVQPPRNQDSEKRGEPTPAERQGKESPESKSVGRTSHESQVVTRGDAGKIVTAESVPDDHLTKKEMPASVPKDEADEKRDDPATVTAARSPESTLAEIPGQRVAREKNELTKPREIEVQSLVTFEKLVIPFPSNSNLPPADSLSKLDKLVETLQGHSSTRLVVTGHTDSQGNESFNEKLSEFRANAVKSYLVGRGLKESDIITHGMGSKYPVASNDTPDGRMSNRRVEIEIAR